MARKTEQNHGGFAFEFCFLGFAYGGGYGMVTLRGRNYALGARKQHAGCKCFELRNVALHQSIIGLEAEKQMEMAGEYPDKVIACFGGGSNFGGIAFPFMRHKFNGSHADTEFIAAEPDSCPKLTRGKFEYDFGDEAGYTPLLPMFTLGHDFKPANIHAGGLRYHGAGMIISQLIKAPSNSSYQTILGIINISTGIHQHEAASTIGVLSLAWLEAVLTKEGSLLVTSSTSNGNFHAGVVHGAINGAGGFYLRQHTHGNIQCFTDFLIKLS